MKNTIKKTAAVLSAAILGALPMVNLLTANAALSNDMVKYVYGDINFDGKIDREQAVNFAQDPDAMEMKL